MQALRYDIEEEMGPQLSTEEDFQSGFFVEENFEQGAGYILTQAFTSLLQSFIFFYSILT